MKNPEAFGGNNEFEGRGVFESMKDWARKNPQLLIAIGAVSLLEACESNKDLPKTYVDLLNPKSYTVPADDIPHSNRPERLLDNDHIFYNPDEGRYFVNNPEKKRNQVDIHGANEHKAYEVLQNEGLASTMVPGHTVDRVKGATGSPGSGDTENKKVRYDNDLAIPGVERTRGNPLENMMHWIDKEEGNAIFVEASARYGNLEGDTHEFNHDSDPNGFEARMTGLSQDSFEVENRDGRDYMSMPMLRQAEIDSLVSLGEFEAFEDTLKISAKGKLDEMRSDTAAELARVVAKGGMKVYHHGKQGSGGSVTEYGTALITGTKEVYAPKTTEKHGYRHEIAIRGYRAKRGHKK